MGGTKPFGSTPLPVGIAALERAALAGDHASAVHRLALAKTRDERLTWQRVLVGLRLQQVADMRKQQVQVYLPRDAGDCTVCRHLHMAVVPVDTPPSDIIPADCPQLASRLCKLLVSGYIKRPT